MLHLTGLPDDSYLICEIVPGTEDVTVSTRCYAHEWGTTQTVRLGPEERRRLAEMLLEGL